MNKNVTLFLLVFDILIKSLTLAEWYRPMLRWVLREAQIPLRRLPRTSPFWGSWRHVTGKSPTWIMLRGNHGDMFRGFKPSRHVEMVWKIPVTSRQLARLSVVETGKWATYATRHGDCRRRVADKSTGMSRVCGGLVADIAGKSV